MTIEFHDPSSNGAVLKSMRGSPVSSAPVRASQMETLLRMLGDSPLNRPLAVGDFNLPDQRLTTETEG